MNYTGHIKRRLGWNAVFKAGVIILSSLCFIPLAAILFYIIARGIKSINWQFLIRIPLPLGEAGGGIANAITGTLLIVTAAAVIAVPLGIMAGIYLGENAGKKLARWTGLSVDILQGIPSIVTGIVVYFWIVKPMRGFSSLSGSIALAIMMLPLVARTTEETLKRLPPSLKEASLALGVPFWCGFFGLGAPFHNFFCWTGGSRTWLGLGFGFRWGRRPLCLDFLRLL